MVTNPGSCGSNDVGELEMATLAAAPLVELLPCGVEQGGVNGAPDRHRMRTSQRWFVSSGSEIDRVPGRVAGFEGVEVRSRTDRMGVLTRGLGRLRLKIDVAAVVDQEAGGAGVEARRCGRAFGKLGSSAFSE